MFFCRPFRCIFRKLEKIMTSIEALQAGIVDLKTAVDKFVASCNGPAAHDPADVAKIAELQAAVDAAEAAKAASDLVVDQATADIALVTASANAGAARDGGTP